MKRSTIIRHNASIINIIVVVFIELRHWVSEKIKWS